MAVKIILITSCTILSLGGATVMDLLPPEGLGIETLLPGLNWNDSSFNFAMISAMTSLENPSRVVGVIPGVMFPGLLLILL